MARRLTALICACVLLACTSWASAAGHSRPVVLILGDSLSAAYRMSPSKGWPVLLQARLDAAGMQYSVQNASRKGETTEDGVKRIATLLDEHRPAVVVLELGANDGLRRYPLANIGDNLRRLVSAVRQAGAKAVVVGMRLPPGYPPTYAAGFERLFPVLADQHDAAYVPFLLERVVDHPEYFMADRLHPNAEGQPLLLETVWSALYPVLATEPAMP